MPTTMPFPTLFKKSSTGALQRWDIRVDQMDGVAGLPGDIVTCWGQDGGAIQDTHDVVRAGKNIGKKNETSPYEQACKEAQSRWEKQLKKGYVTTPAAAKAGQLDAIIEGGIAPMLAHRFDEQGHKIKYPAYAQPKLDGHRCIAVLKDGKCTLWSRTRKRITGVPHIERAMEQFACSAGTDGIFDGELYTHEYRNKFEQLTSFIRQETPKPGHEVVQFHIYDLANMPQPFFARTQNLECLFLSADDAILDVLKQVETIKVADEDELMLAFEKFLALGYEGCMVRNADSPYENKRSYGLQKVKEFIDNEFKVLDVEEGRGKLAGHAIFVCGSFTKTFRVKMKGETAELKKYWEDSTLAVGKMLTVKYQGMTSEGVPRFPVGLRLREDV